MTPSKAQIDNEIAQAEKRLERLYRRQEQLASRPEDVYNDGAVLVVHTHNVVDRSAGVLGWASERAYDYALIKAAGRWYVTGQFTGGLDWDKVLDLAEGGEMWEATDFVQVEL